MGFLFGLTSLVSPCMQFSFEHISYLYGLLVFIPLLILFGYVVIRKNKITALMGPYQLIKPLMQQYSSTRYFIKFLLPLLSLLLIVIAAANLRSPKKGAPTARKGIDVMIALDVSKSMWSEDVKPTRIDLARQMLQTLVDKASNNNIGLVVFAGKPYLQLPLTGDIVATKLSLYSASPDIVPIQGTDIAAALNRCVDAFENTDEKYKAIVLVSDGENHEAGMEETISRLKDAGIMVYSVGVGTSAGGTITEPGAGDYKKNVAGQTIVTQLQAENLKAISTATNGAYYALSESRSQAETIATSINNLEQKTLSAQTGGLKEYTPWYAYITALGICCLVIELFIPVIKSKA